MILFIPELYFSLFKNLIGSVKNGKLFIDEI